MTTATLTYIGKPSDPWGDRQLIFIDLQFSDHDPGSLATNERGLASRIRELEDRRGKPSEYEFSDNGRGGFKVKLPKAEDAPAKSGSKWTPKTPEERAEILAMNAMSALAQVAAHSGGFKDLDGHITALEYVKFAMRGLYAEARSILNVEAGGGSSAPIQTRPVTSSGVPVGSVQPGVQTPASTLVGTGGEAKNADGAATAPPDAGTTPPHPYLGNRDIAEPCRVLGCELQEENPIHVKRGQ